MRWPPAGGFPVVLTEIAALWGDVPAGVDAATEIENDVFAASPPTVALVVVVVWFCAPFTNTRYVIVQPGALDAFHCTLTLLFVWLGELSPVGAAGTVVHDAPPRVVAVIVALAAETFPALSRARTA